MLPSRRAVGSPAVFASHLKELQNVLEEFEENMGFKLIDNAVLIDHLGE